MLKYTSLNDFKLLSETALESSLAGIWDWNMVTNEEYLSPRFKEIFGYADDEMENSPESWQKIAFEEDLPGMFESFEKHINSLGAIPFETVVRYHHKNGKTVWVRCNGKVVEWSKEGKPMRSIGCHIDITEEKQIELELKRTIKEKDVLLGEVHHRVKNNLQMIQSLARLKQKNDRVEIHEIEDTISAIASAHEAIYRAERFDIIDFDKYISRIINPLLAGQKIQFELVCNRVTKPIDVLIPIGLMLIECANNSIKHGFLTNSKAKRIDISIQENENGMEVIYKDNGPGYAQAVLNSIETLDSFGLILINSLAEQISGNIVLSNDGGAKMVLTVGKSELE